MKTRKKSWAMLCFAIIALFLHLTYCFSEDVYINPLSAVLTLLEIVLSFGTLWFAQGEQKRKPALICAIGFVIVKIIPLVQFLVTLQDFGLTVLLFLLNPLLGFVIALIILFYVQGKLHGVEQHAGTICVVCCLYCLSFSAANVNGLALVQFFPMFMHLALCIMIGICLYGPQEELNLTEEEQEQKKKEQQQFMSAVGTVISVVVSVLFFLLAVFSCNGDSSSDSYSRCYFRQNGEYVCSAPASRGSNFCFSHQNYLDDAYNTFVGN